MVSTTLLTNKKNYRSFSLSNSLSQIFKPRPSCASHHLRYKTEKQSSKKHQYVEKTRSIELNKASFETKTRKENRTQNEHRKKVYQALIKTKIPEQKPFKAEKYPRL